MEPDFSGWATKAGLKCSDGRTIMPDAFKDQDKMTVPLVWQHGHDNPENVLGHTVLYNRPEGVWADGFFNETAKGQSAKVLVQHKDITQLSIWANQLVEKAKQVFHGSIKEVSLVLAGANPGAMIDPVSIRHSADDVEVLDDEAIIYTGLTLQHADAAAADEGPTVQDVYDSFSDPQKEVVHFMIGAALEAAGKVEHSDEGDGKGDNADDADNGDEGEDKSDDKSKTNNSEDSLDHKDKEGTTIVTNVFEQGATGTATAQLPTLTHDQMKTVMDDARKLGSFKDAVLAHADEYGITNVEVLFPDAVAIDNKPEWITRRMEWVETVLNGTKKLPFSKIKSLSADLTHEEARAKGYIKGTMKKEQFFAVAKRETSPKTIYKKQKLDRDDIIDATEFDIVAWLWVEMRFMLREEIARAILVGDGREVDDEDKIDETKIRPIAFDDEFYTDVVVVPTNLAPEDTVEAILRAREFYKGVGQPTAFMLQGTLTDLVLVKDRMGRRLYRTVAELAAELQVSEIIPVPVMEGVTRDDAEVLVILVNLADYAVGSTRGGEVTTFDDFDIDFNQYKYLIEGRLSGALTKHKTAQVFVRGTGGTEVTADVPTFNNGTGVVTIPTVAGVVYKNDDTDATLASGAQAAIAIGATLNVRAETDATHYFAHNTDNDWSFKRV